MGSPGSPGATARKADGAPSGLGERLRTDGDEIISAERDEYFITITNASRDRDIVVTHVWIESDPPVHVHDPDLPVRLRYSAPWETSVLAEDVPAAPEEVPWLARCQLSPDDKVIKSRPPRNVPPFGTVPRG